VIGYPAAFSLMGIVSLAALPLIRGLVRPRRGVCLFKSPSGSKKPS
jgi:hypothetical protein